VAVCGIRHGVLFHCIGFTQCRSAGLVAEQPLIVSGDTADRCRPIRIQRDRARLCIVGILANARFQSAAQCGFPLIRERSVISLAGLGGCPAVEHGKRLPMQPIGAPVRRHVTAMAPDRAKLHAADRLPHLPTSLEGGTCVDHLATTRQDSLRHGRGLLMDFASHPEQDRERTDEEDRKRGPQSASAIHACAPFVAPSNGYGRQVLHSA
jgi:hypothetical protein